MPYLKWSTLPRASILRSLSAGKLPYTVLSPLPHSTQGKLSTQAVRDVRLKRGKEWVGALSLVPTAKWGLERSAHLLCPVRWLRYWTRPLASPLLSSSVLSCSSGYTPSQSMHHLSPGSHHFTQVLPWGQVLEQMAQAELLMQGILSAAVKNLRHTAFLSPLEGKVVMRKWTWKTNPAELRIVREPEGPFVPWTASFVLCRQPVSTAMHMRPYCGSILRGLALTHGGSFP